MRRHRLRVAITVALCIGFAAGFRTEAQSLNLGLFDRYIEALRQEYRIPGLSVALVQNRTVVMARGLGQADLSRAIPARPDTPYPIANLSESVGAALVLRNCVQFGTARIDDQLVRWMPPGVPSLATSQDTFESVLSHVSTNGVYAYSPARFETLGDAAAECSELSYRQLAASMFDRLAMRRSVPGRDAIDEPAAEQFAPQTLERYRAVLGDLAVPYRISATGVATRSEYTPRPLTASTGVISTVLDLAEFDRGLDSGDVMSLDLLNESVVTRANRPTGLGWFVQTYPSASGAGVGVVWNFGVVKDAYSSLIVRIPSQRLTLIMLANSDALTAQINPTQPDVTQSIFARTFLRLFAG